MQFDFKSIDLGNIRLAYVEQGHGTPIILIHGGGTTDLRTWGQQIEPFAAHFRVIAYSQRYHYPNAWVGDGSDINSTAVHAADLASFIGALRLDGVHLIGVSYGADIVLRLAVDHPELSRTLVVTEPALFSWLSMLPGGAHLFAEYAAMMRPAKQAVQNGDWERGIRFYIDSFMGVGLYDQLPASVLARIRDNIRLLSLEPTEMSDIGQEITREEAATIQAPTLVLTGDDSPEMFTLVSQELARHLPKAEQAQIEDASHLLHVMNPPAYNAAVLAFLAKHSG
jgi:pimeloyl-ACP methyl ester carboxylesterase